MIYLNLALAALLVAVHFNSILLGIIVWCVAEAVLLAVENQAIKTRNLLREIQRELRKDRR